MDQKIQKARERLANMEIEAAKVLNIREEPTNAAFTKLENAIRTLMVAMHSCQQLPPQLAEAAAAVTTCLPVPPVSLDYLEETAPEGAENKRSLEAEAAMTEFDMVDDEDEQAFIAMARRLKKARRSGPY